MALIDDDVKHVIDSNKARNYKRQTKEMFKAWLDSCPVKYVDVTSNELEQEGKIKTLDLSITERK